MIRYIGKETLLIWLENMCVSEYIRKCIDDDKKFKPANVRENISSSWILGLNHCQCNNCKTKFRFDRSNTEFYSNFINFDHCPKCGSKMTNSYIFKRW